MGCCKASNEKNCTKDGKERTHSTEHTTGYAQNPAYIAATLNAQCQLLCPRSLHHPVPRRIWGKGNRARWGLALSHNSNVRSRKAHRQVSVVQKGRPAPWVSTCRYFDPPLRSRAVLDMPALAIFTAVRTVVPFFLMTKAQLKRTFFSSRMMMMLKSHHHHCQRDRLSGHTGGFMIPGGTAGVPGGATLHVYTQQEMETSSRSARQRSPVGHEQTCRKWRKFLSMGWYMNHPQGEANLHSVMFWLLV